MAPKWLLTEVTVSSLSEPHNHGFDVEHSFYHKLARPDVRLQKSLLETDFILCPILRKT